jgi:Cu/Ag efflux protein CusF
MALGFALMLPGCGEAAVDPASDPDADVYQLRGEVMSLPAEGTAGEVMIRHEAIADFRDRSGEPVGMNTMEMGFQPAEPGVLEGLEVGDKIEFRWSVNFERNSMVFDAVRVLDDEVELDFGPRATQGEGHAGLEHDHDHAGHEHDDH